MIDPTFFPSLVRFTLTSSLLAFPIAAQSVSSQAQDLALVPSGSAELVAFQNQDHARVLFVGEGDQGEKCCDHECKAESKPQEIRVRRNATGNLFSGNHFSGNQWTAQGQGGQPRVMVFGADAGGLHADHDSHGENGEQNVEVQLRVVGPDGEVHEFDGGRGGSWHGLFGNADSGNADSGHANSEHGGQLHGMHSEGDHPEIFFGRGGSDSGQCIERRIIIDGSEGGPHLSRRIQIPHVDTSGSNTMRSWTSDDGQQTFVIKVETDESGPQRRDFTFGGHGGQWRTKMQSAPKASNGGCACCGCSSNRAEVHESRAHFGGHGNHWTSSTDHDQTIEVEIEADDDAFGDPGQGERSFTFDVSDSNTDGDGLHAFTIELDDDGQPRTGDHSFGLFTNAHHSGVGNSEHGTVEILSPGQNSFIISADGPSNGAIELDLPDFESMDLEEIIEWAEEQGDSTQVELNSLTAPAPKPERPAPNAEQASQDIIIV